MWNTECACVSVPSPHFSQESRTLIWSLIPQGIFFLRKYSPYSAQSENPLWDQISARLSCDPVRNAG